MKLFYLRKKDFPGRILYKVVDRPKTTIILISPSPTLSTNPRKNLNLSRKIKPNSFSFAAQGGDQKCYSKDEQPDHWFIWSFWKTKVIYFWYILRICHSKNVVKNGIKKPTVFLVNLYKYMYKNNITHSLLFTRKMLRFRIFALENMNLR